MSTTTPKQDDVPISPPFSQAINVVFSVISPSNSLTMLPAQRPRRIFRIHLARTSASGVMLLRCSTNNTATVTSRHTSTSRLIWALPRDHSHPHPCPHPPPQHPPTLATRDRTAMATLTTTTSTAHHQARDSSQDIQPRWPLRPRRARTKDILSTHRNEVTTTTIRVP